MSRQEWHAQHLKERGMAEDALMSAALRNEECAARLVVDLDHGDIGDPDDRRIYDAICSLLSDGREVSATAVCQAAHADGRLMGKVLELGDDPATPRAYADNLATVRHFASLEALVAGAEGMLARIYDHDDGDVAGLVAGMQAAIDAAMADDAKRPVAIADVMDGYLAGLVARDAEDAPELEDAAGGAATRIPLSFLPSLDAATGGLPVGHVTVIGGRPGDGKTTLSLNIAYAAAARQDLPVLIFSMEMSQVEIAERLMSMGTGIDHDLVQARWLTERQAAAIRDLARRARERDRFWVFDVHDLTPAQIEAIIRTTFHGRPGLVVIDYFQLLHLPPAAWKAGVTTAWSQTMHQLTVCAGRQNVAMVVNSQLNRSGIGAPRLADLKMTGAIEEDAYLVLLLDKADEAHDEDGSDRPDPGIMRVHIAKDRAHGATNAWLDFKVTDASGYIQDLDPEAPAPAREKAEARNPEVDLDEVEEMFEQTWQTMSKKAIAGGAADPKAFYWSFAPVAQAHEFGGISPMWVMTKLRDGIAGFKLDEKTGNVIPPAPGHRLHLVDEDGWDEDE